MPALKSDSGWANYMIILQFCSPAKAPELPLPIIRGHQESSIFNRFGMPNVASRTFPGMFPVSSLFEPESINRKCKKRWRQHLPCHFDMVEMAELPLFVGSDAYQQVRHYGVPL